LRLEIGFTDIMKKNGALKHIIKYLTESKKVRNINIMHFKINWQLSSMVFKK
jgi:hypothetical protein